MTLSIKSCPKCKTDGMYNRDEIYCPSHPKTKLVPMTLIATKELETIKAVIAKLSEVARQTKMLRGEDRGLSFASHSLCDSAEAAILELEALRN